MKHSILILVVGFLGFVQSVHASEKDYSSLEVGDVKKVEIEELHPTQFRVGEAEVDVKSERFKEMSPDKLKQYLKAHPCPVVIGPDGIPYITDMQHRANARYDAESSSSAVHALQKHGEPIMYMKVIANYSTLTPEEFEKKMIGNHYTYLDDLGKPRPFKELPRHIFEMKNDPYRSVAGFVERKAYNMADVYFVQFQVAQWLRDHLKMSDHDVTHELEHHREAFLAKVSQLLESPEAKSEPWYMAAPAPALEKGYSALEVGEVKKVEIEELHPTQFRVGEAEVEMKSERFKEMSPDKLKEYLKAHPCPVVIGPDGLPYITDMQHRANASYDAETSSSAVHALKKHGEPIMYMKVIANYSDLTPEEFEKKMIENHYTYLDDLGKPRPFNELPRHIFEMKNDPYRSVAGFVERKAYNMADVYFVQFQVAQWLRDHLKMSDQEVNHELKHNREAFLAKVSQLLESPEAKSEPWYLHAPSGCEKAFAAVKK